MSIVTIDVDGNPSHKGPPIQVYSKSGWNDIDFYYDTGLFPNKRDIADMSCGGHVLLYGHVNKI